MSNIAGYLSTVFLVGPSTAMTGEATALVSGKTYRLTNTAHRILNPSVAVVVKDNGVVVGAANIAARDYLFGQVTFVAGYTVTGPVTIDGAFYTLMALPGAFDAKLSRKNDMKDATVYAQGDAQKRRAATLMDCELALKGRGTGFEDYDTTTVGTQNVQTLAANGTPTLIQLDPGSSNTWVHRGWYILEDIQDMAPLDDLVEYDLLAQAAPQGATSIDRAGFGWGAP